MRPRPLTAARLAISHVVLTLLLVPTATSSGAQPGGAGGSLLAGAARDHGVKRPLDRSDSMLELFGYLACGCLLGVASLLGGKLPLQSVVLNIGLGMIGVLLMALIPRLGAPEDEVRAALLGNPAVVLSFYFALMSALGYGAVQMLAPMTPEDLLPRLQRWADHALVVAGALTILGLAEATLTL